MCVCVCVLPGLAGGTSGHSYGSQDPDLGAAVLPPPCASSVPGCHAAGRGLNPDQPGSVHHTI